MKQLAVIVPAVLLISCFLFVDWTHGLAKHVDDTAIIQHQDSVIAEQKAQIETLHMLNDGNDRLIRMKDSIISAYSKLCGETAKDIGRMSQKVRNMNTVRNSSDVFILQGK